MENTYDYKKFTFISGSVALATIALLALVMSVSEWKTMSRGGSQSASITVSGEGEVTAAPDIATVTFTIRESAKTVPEAQKLAEAKLTKALASLDTLGVDKKDTKTLSYTVNPKYENVPVSYSGYIAMPVYTNPKIVGYEIAETIQVKVRKIDSAGEVIGALGAVSVTEISGPDFTVDDMDKVQAEAKEKAIADAREKAEKTAKALGVSLGAIIQFSENNGGYYPMYSKTMMADGRGGAATPEVTVPQGESVIKSNVSVTYSLN